MGIRIKNTAEYDEQFFKGGAAAAANDLFGFTAPAAGYIKAIIAAFGIMGTDGTGAPTQDVRVDIKKNGTSIFPNASSPYIAWAHAGQVGTANTPSAPTTYNGQVSAPGVGMAPVAVAKNDYIQMDILQILNGTSPTQPKDLSVMLVFSRGQLWAPETTLLGTFSELDF